MHVNYMVRAPQVPLLLSQTNGKTSLSGRRPVHVQLARNHGFDSIRSGSGPLKFPTVPTHDPKQQHHS